MRPTGIERDDRVRLVASFAVSAILYSIVFLILALLPAARGTGGVTAKATACRPVSLTLTLARSGRPEVSGRPGLSALPAAAAASAASPAVSVHAERSPNAAGMAVNPAVPAANAEIPPSGEGMAANPAVPAATAVSGSQSPASQTGETPAAAWPGGDNSTGGNNSTDGNNSTGGSSSGGNSSASTTGGNSSASGGNSAGDGAVEGGDMTVGSGAFTGGMTGRREFLSWLDAALIRGLAYPERAKKRGIEGTVWIYVEVPPDGKACRAAVETSSGSGILDRSALTLVESLFPAPVSPEKEFSGTIKIQYILVQD